MQTIGEVEFLRLVKSGKLATAFKWLVTDVVLTSAVSRRLAGLPLAGVTTHVFISMQKARKFAEEANHFTSHTFSYVLVEECLFTNVRTMLEEADNAQ